MNNIIQDCESSKWPRGIGDKTHVAILTALTLAIGIYFVSTTVLIARDGVFYIEFAQKIASNVIDAVDGTDHAPGYPFMIYLLHKAIGLFCSTESLWGWIISAQIVSLLSKLIAAISLYFVGSFFAGSRCSFWGVLVLSILPDCVSYGSDALTDWPNIMFLAIGFFLLLLGAQYRQCWMFGCAGAASGLGYLVRPECGQVALCGSVWLLFNLIRPQGKMKKTKAAGALIVLLASFGIIAIPYMWFKGHVFPEQGIGEFRFMLGVNQGLDSIMNSNLCLAGLSVGGIIGRNALLTNTSETLMYYFLPAMAVGCCCYFRNISKQTKRIFFAAAIILVNVAIVVWQSECRDTPRMFLSRRHTLPLIAFSAFYIPIGVQIIAGWLTRKHFKDDLAIEKNIRSWFCILMAAGICISAVKLYRMAPLRWEKQGYRDAAEWLNKNTDSRDSMAVPDRRILFYAERKGLEYSAENNNGTATANTSILHTAGFVNGAFQFTGGQRVVIPDNSILDFGNDDFSISLIVKVTGYADQGSSWNSMLSKGDLSHTISPFFGLYVGSDNHMYFIAGNIKEYALSDHAMNDGLYHPVVAVRRSGQLLLYVDGVLQARMGTFDGSVTNSVPMILGADGGATRYFAGSLDEIRLYNRPLAAPEMTLPADLQDDTGYGLVGYWNLDDNTDAQVVLDSAVKIPAKVGYVVRIERYEEKQSGFNANMTEVYSTWINSYDKKKKVVIYKVIE